MPNKPRAENPARPIRFDALWADVERLAESDGVTPSEVVREAVRRYVKARKRKRVTSATYHEAQDSTLGPSAALRLAACPTCSGPNRETVGMVCQTCGTDYGAP